MAKKGLEFELFVKAIYEEILNLEGYDTVRVEHDIKILGKSKQLHQIDIYWEFKVASETHRVAVECKDYKNTIGVGKIRDFYGVLDDIGDIHGVFVTTKGYQSGAITYGKHKDIALKTVKKPTQKDIDNYQGIKTINLNINADCINNVNMRPVLDIDWAIKNTNIKEGDAFSATGLNIDIKIIDSNFNLLGSIFDFENKLPRYPRNTSGLTHKYEFDDGFIHIPDLDYPPLKLKSLNFTYDTYTINLQNQINFELMAKAVLRDIITGESHLYNKKPIK